LYIQSQSKIIPFKRDAKSLTTLNVYRRRKILVHLTIKINLQCVLKISGTAYMHTEWYISIQWHIDEVFSRYWRKISQWCTM